MSAAASAEIRRESLKEVFREARVCVRCPQLAQSRTQVVFGAGNADADLLFVGEAPGEKEDQQGVPFVGAAGKLLGKLLEDIGLSREEVFIANVLKCRPPQNRDPLPQEIERCEPWLWRQIELIEPTVVVTLGRYATGLLRGEMVPLGAVRGKQEIRVLGTRAVRLYPVLHPAAALYRREPNLRLLEEDFARIPALLAQGPPDQPPVEAAEGGEGGAAPEGGASPAESSARAEPSVRAEPSAPAEPSAVPGPGPPAQAGPGEKGTAPTGDAAPEAGGAVAPQDAADAPERQLGLF
jgi:DNA polymerase